MGCERGQGMCTNRMEEERGMIPDRHLEALEAAVEILTFLIVVKLLALLVGVGYIAMSYIWRLL